MAGTMDSTNQPPRGVCPACGVDWRPILEAADISGPAGKQMGLWRKKLGRWTWFYLASMLIVYLIQKQSPGGSFPGGWIAGVEVALAIAPMIALLAGQSIGEKRIHARVFREAGVFCTDCGQTPPSKDLVDWIASNRCGKCGGNLHRDFASLEYKESWPKWEEHVCHTPGKLPESCRYARKK